MTEAMPNDPDPPTAPAEEEEEAPPRPEVPTAFDAFGRPRDRIEADDLEAATQWDARLWSTGGPG